MKNLTIIDLSQNYIDGIIVTEIGYLTSITELNFYVNSLTGPIPTELCSLTALSSLFLGINMLSSSIPTEIGNLINMVYLELEYNILSGAIPTEIGNLTSLTSFEVSTNLLTGVIPTEIGGITNLSELYLDTNQLRGRIPTEIGYLTNIRIMYMYTNQLSDNIPTEIGNLRNITTIILEYNNLVGSIPTETGYLADILEINLYSNYFSGSIPTEVGYLTSLTYLDIGTNFLTGGIPTEIGNLRNITTIFLDHNNLVGPIPTEIGNLRNMKYVLLDINNLVGPIPTEIGYLADIQQMYLLHNCLSGSIPTEIGFLTSLSYLNIGTNFLTGGIPTEIGHLKALTSLDISLNYLMGVIPTEIGILTDFNGLDLLGNQLTGKIPPHISNATKLQLLYLSINLLSGQFPTQLGNLVALQQLSVKDNLLSGLLISELQYLTKLEVLSLDSNKFSPQSIPSFFNNFVSMTNLTMSHNQFTGVIPSLQQLIELQQLDISSNHLTSGLSDIYLESIAYLNISYNEFGGSVNSFLPSDLHDLQFIDISNNKFTGSIPDNIFLSSNVFCVVLEVNCFSSSISTNICNAVNLQVLILDAVGGAKSCLGKVLPFFDAYTLVNKVEGGIPSCVYSLPYLNTLHLSGNGILGSLDDIESISSSLVNLDLSYNDLKGEIPSVICNHNWETLDLSFNKITGTLCSNIHVNTSLSLDINRLSGPVSSSYDKISSISILNGNIYTCGSSIPTNDPNYRLYSCGSDVTNQSIYVCLVIFGAFLGFIIFVYCRNKMRQLSTATLLNLLSGNMIMEYWFENESSLNIQNETRWKKSMLHFGINITKLIIWSIAGIILASLLHIKYSTFEYSYIWLISLGFLSGPTVAASIACYTIMTEFIAYRILHISVDFDKVSLQSTEPQQYSSPAHSTSTPAKEIIVPTHWLMLCILFFLNLATTVTVNIYFVLTVNNLRGVEYNLLQVGLSVFKFLWENVIIGLMVDWSKKLYMKHQTPKVDAVFRTVLNIVAIMIAPCIATAIASPDCFYYVLFQAPTISTTYDVSVCDGVNSFSLNCEELGYISAISSYLPVFEYSYQCSSSLMTEYTAVFIYFILESAIIQPVIHQVFRMFQFWLRSKQVKEETWNNNTAVDSDIEKKHTDKELMLKQRFTLSSTILQIMDYFLMRPEKSKSDEYQIKLEKYYGCSEISADVITVISVGMTFGQVFPLLMILCIIGLIIQNMFRQLEISRILTMCHETDQKVLVEAIDHNFQHFNHQIRVALPLLILLNSTFMSLFFFDALGDAEGYDVAIAPTVMLALFPFIVLMFIKTVLYSEKYRCVRLDVFWSLWHRQDQSDSSYVEFTEDLKIRRNTEAMDPVRLDRNINNSRSNGGGLCEDSTLKI